MTDELKLNFMVDDSMKDNLVMCNKETFKTLVCIMQDEIENISY